MYYDLSLLPTSTLDLAHLLRSISPSPYCAVAIDHEFTDTLVTPPGDILAKIKEIVSNDKLNLKVYSRATLAI